MSDNIQDSGIWQLAEIHPEPERKTVGEGWEPSKAPTEKSQDWWFGGVIGFVLLVMFFPMFVFAGASAIREVRSDHKVIEVGAQTVCIQTTPNEWSERVDVPYDAGVLCFSRPVTVKFHYPGGHTGYLRNASYVHVDACPRQFSILGEPAQAEANGGDRVEVMFKK